MRYVFRVAALAAAIAAVGLVNPADAKPKHKHGDDYHAYADHAYGHHNRWHADRHYRGPGYPYSGSSMAPGWQGWHSGERPPGWSHGAKRGCTATTCRRDCTGSITASPNHSSGLGWAGRCRPLERRFRWHQRCW